MAAHRAQMGVVSRTQAFAVLEHSPCVKVNVFFVLILGSVCCGLLCLHKMELASGRFWGILSGKLGKAVPAGLWTQNQVLGSSSKQAAHAFQFFLVNNRLAYFSFCKLVLVGCQNTESKTDFELQLSILVLEGQSILYLRFRFKSQERPFAWPAQAR